MLFAHSDLSMFLGVGTEPVMISRFSDRGRVSQTNKLKVNYLPKQLKYISVFSL